MAVAANAGFMMLTRELWRSPAWRSLSGDATRLLIDMWDKYNKKNNGSIPYGITEAMACLHCSRPTATKRLRELQTAGLIESTRKAYFSNKSDAGKGVVTHWRLTFLP